MIRSDSEFGRISCLNETNVFIEQQVLHYSSISIRPRKMDDVHFLTLEDLPHMINPIEAKLGE